jgi:hypothetical protein
MARVRTSRWVVAGLALAAAPAAAWAPETRVEIVDDAVRLMPESLRLALERQREALLRGMLEPMSDEDGPDHRPPWSAGRLDESVVDAVGRLQRSLAQQAGFVEIARGFGELAHFVSDAGFPPGATSEAGRRYTHFARFCEGARARFPLVFDGYSDAELATGDYRAFALRILRTAREDDRQLAIAYAAAGDPPDPAAFDDRSVPFAVGSLSYSRTVTDLARAWLAVWATAGGDVGRMPYLRPPAIPSAGGP